MLAKPLPAAKTWPEDGKLGKVDRERRVGAEGRFMCICGVVSLSIAITHVVVTAASEGSHHHAKHVSTTSCGAGHTLGA